MQEKLFYQKIFSHNKDTVFSIYLREILNLRTISLENAYALKLVDIDTGETVKIFDSIQQRDQWIIDD